MYVCMYVCMYMCVLNIYIYISEITKYININILDPYIYIHIYKYDDNENVCVYVYIYIRYVKTYWKYWI